MADINLSSGAGKTVFAQLYDSGTPVGPEILLTEIGQLGEYYGDVEPGTDPGKYVVVFLSDGAKLTSGMLEWDGEKEITLASVENTIPLAEEIAAAVEVAILTEGDGRAVLQAIADKIGNENLSAAAVASAVWTAESRTLTSPAAPTLAEIEASAVLAKQAAIEALPQVGDIVDANIVKVNDIYVEGVGSQANPWGPVP
jgi:hypothetical protein